MDQITLKDGRTFRVELNWNAIVAFLDSTGRDNITALANLAQMKPSDLSGLLAASINEGARLDGKPGRLTPEEVGELADVRVMTDFIRIFNSQTQPKGAAPEGKKG